VIKRIRSFVNIYSSNNRVLSSIYESLLPETLEPPNPQRTWTKILFEKDARTVALEINSRDLSSHRAALNTYLYILNSVVKTLEVFIRSS